MKTIVYDDMIFKIIEDFENYAISECGKIISIGNCFNRKTKYLKYDYNSNTHPKVGLRKSKGVAKRFYVHRLVALMWVPNPENKMYVNHKDLDKNNYHASNLEWCTSSENQFHYTLNLNSVNDIKAALLKKIAVELEKYNTMYNTNYKIE